MVDKMVSKSNAGRLDLPSIKHSKMDQYTTHGDSLFPDKVEHSPVVLPENPSVRHDKVGTSGSLELIEQRPNIVVRATSLVFMHHARQLKSCTWNNFWTTNSTYNSLYLGSMITDYKTLINGNESFERMQFLEEEGHSISETVFALNREQGIDVLNANRQRLRLSLLTILVFWVFSIVGLVQVTVDTLIAPTFSSLNFVALCASFLFFSVCSSYYLSYAYHSYAVQQDRFVTGREFFIALYRCDARAWLPLILKE